MVDDNNADERDSGEDYTEPSQTISLFLAIGLTIGALIIGLVVGYVAAPKSAATVAPDTQTQQAPQLSPDQIQGGKLPPGHPTVPGKGSTATTEGTTPTQ